MEIEIIDNNLKNENFYKKYRRDIIISKLLVVELENNRMVNYDNFYLFESENGHPSCLIKSIDFLDKKINLCILNTYSGKMTMEMVKSGFNIVVDLNKKIIFYD